MDTTGNIPARIVLTQDIKPQWLNVLRRLQAACHGNRAFAILSIRVLVDGDGIPVCWTEPVRTKLEPKSLVFDALLTLTETT